MKRICKIYSHFDWKNIWWEKEWSNCLIKFIKSIYFNSNNLINTLIIYCLSNFNFLNKKKSFLISLAIKRMYGHLKFLTSKISLEKLKNN